ncbi:MAG: hypothetical protein ACJ8C4_10375 [Gemmataceae bacterium]
MRKLWIACLFVCGLCTTASTLQAHGHRRDRDCCDSGCGVSACCNNGCNSCGNNNCCAPAVTWQDKQVTCTRMVTKTRMVQREVCEMCPRQVECDVSYCVMERVCTPVTRTVNYCEKVWVDQPYTYTVCCPVMVPETRNVTCYETRMTQVPYTYCVSVPHTETVMTCRTRTICEPQQVTEMRCVCRQVPVTTCDPCTGCPRTCCHTVREMVPCCKTVMCRRCVTEQCPVQVCRYHSETRQGMRTCCERVPVCKQVTVNCCKMVPQQRTGCRKVCQIVPRTCQVTENCVSCRPTTRTCKVCKTVCEPVKRMINVCESYCEPCQFTYTVKVCVPCAQPAPCAACNTCGQGCGGCGQACGGCGNDCGHHDCCHQDCCDRGHRHGHRHNDCCESDCGHGRRGHFAGRRHNDCCGGCS